MHAVELKCITNDLLYSFPKALNGLNYHRFSKKTAKTNKIKLTAGEFLHPFTKEKIPPPIAPIANAPPQSSTIR